MDQSNAAQFAGLLRMSRSGELRLGNRRLHEGTAVDVWLAGAWQPGQVARVGAEWTLRLADGSAVPALGAIARLPAG